MEAAIKKRLFDAGFRTRALSAILLAPTVLGILYLGGNFFLALMIVVAAISVYEWSHMTLSDKKDTINKMLIPATIFFSAATVAITGILGNPAITLWIVLAFCFFIFSFNIAHQGPSINRFIFGIVYIVFAIEVMVWIRNFAPNGLFHTITLLISVWATDTFAYVSGKTIGGPKLAPKISPNKTWAGLIGGALGSALSLMALAIFLPNHLIFSGFGCISYFVMGLVLAIFGQLGDLLISIVKRFYGVKDTGNLIPGHGGILDRIDALIMVAIIFGSLVISLT